MKKAFFLLTFVLIVYVSFSYSNTRINFLETSFVNGYPTLPLEVCYSKLTPSEKKFIAIKIKSFIKSQLPPDILNNINSYLGAVSDDKYRSYLKKLADIISSDDVDEIIKIMDGLDKKELVKVDPKIFRIYHNMVSFNLRSSESIENIPAFLKDDFKVLNNLEFSDFSVPFSFQMPVDSFKVKFSSGNNSFGELCKLANFNNYVIYNSYILSDALNQLSNVDSKGIYAPIKFRDGNKDFVLKRPVDLINALYSSKSYDLVAYEARMGVDFIGMTMKAGNNYFGLEIPDFAITKVNDRKICMPANHSEHLLVVYKKGSSEPLAIAKWYMGLPSDSHLHQSTIWKPAVFTRSSWTGYKITHVYNKLDNLQNLVHGARYLMKTFNMLQKQYGFKYNGYGIIAVCNDSTSLLETIMGNKGDITPFPNMRSIAFDGFYSKVLSKFGGNLKLDSSGHLNVTADVYPEQYSYFSGGNASERLIMCLPFRNKSGISGSIGYKKSLEILENIDYSFDDVINRVIQD